MKILINFLRSVLYVIVSLISISVIYLAFGWLMEYLISGIEYFASKLHGIVFWLLFVFIGWLLIKICINIFSMIAHVLVGLISILCPNITFASWVATIFAISNLGVFLYVFWNSIIIDSFLTGITAFVIAILAVFLTYDIVNSTHQAIKIRDKHY